MAYRDDQCPYGDEWRNGDLINPTRKGKKFFVDVRIFVNSASLVPCDADSVAHDRRRGTHACYKQDVEISKERFEELTGGDK